MDLSIEWEVKHFPLIRIFTVYITRVAHGNNIDMLLSDILNGNVYKSVNKTANTFLKSIQEVSVHSGIQKVWGGMERSKPFSWSSTWVVIKESWLFGPLTPDLVGMLDLRQGNFQKYQ